MAKYDNPFANLLKTLDFQYMIAYFAFKMHSIFDIIKRLAK